MVTERLPGEVPSDATSHRSLILDISSPNENSVPDSHRDMRREGIMAISCGFSGARNSCN